MTDPPLLKLKIVNTDDLNSGIGEVREAGVNDGAVGFYLKIHEHEFILSEAAALKLGQHLSMFFDDRTENG